MFLTHSYKQFFENGCGPGGKLGYIKAHYDVSAYYYQYEDNPQGNTLNRLRNLLVSAINEEILLPKAILIVLDDDLMDELNHYNTGISASIGKLIEWVMNEMHHIVTSHKLPSKARKFKFPTILWALIPTHQVYDHYNEFKKKFNKVVVNTANLFKEM